MFERVVAPREDSIESRWASNLWMLEDYLNALIAP